MSSDPTPYVTDHLRTHDFDWYAALLFVPAAKRPALTALFAFLADIRRIRSLISDPMAGEIRLQWWRDALTGTAHGTVEANPVAAALLAAIHDHNLPTAPLLSAIDARSFDLYDDAMPTTGDFEGYAGEVMSGPLALAASVLTGESPARFADRAGHGGVAMTVSHALQTLPQWVARGQCYLPSEMMSQHGLARGDLRSGKASPALKQTLRAFATYGLEHWDKAEKAEATNPLANGVWLPLSLARHTLKAADRWANDPFARPLTAPRWRRLYRLWRASKAT